MILICGFRRSGKDHLFHQLRNEESFNLKIWSKESSNTKFPIIGLDYVRISFADALKQQVAESLCISVEELEIRKDKVVEGKDYTYRDVLIKVAAEARAKDINHWVKTALMSVEDLEGKRVVITDVRYLNEIEYIRKLNLVTTTIRVFNSSVEVPGLEVISERSLDLEETDFLVIRDDVKTETSSEGYSKCCSLFPQYAKYHILE